MDYRKSNLCNLLVNGNTAIVPLHGVQMQTWRPFSHIQSAFSKPSNPPRTHDPWPKHTHRTARFLMNTLVCWGSNLHSSDVTNTPPIEPTFTNEQCDSSKSKEDEDPWCGFSLWLLEFNAKSDWTLCWTKTTGSCWECQELLLQLGLCCSIGSAGLYPVNWNWNQSQTCHGQLAYK